MKRLVERLHPSRSAAWSVLLVMSIYAITLGVLETRGFWIIDNANKFLQMQAILESDYQDFSLPWPGQQIFPDLEFNPIPAPFTHVRDGKLYSFYAPFFATVSTVPYRFFGMAGLYLIPWLSALGTLAGMARLARVAGGSARTRAVTVLLGGLGSPLWFYSVVFWEHIPAVCFAVWGVAFVLQAIQEESDRHLIAGCAFATLAIYFRDELYLLCGVLAALVLFMSHPHRFRRTIMALVTMAVVIAPLWVFQTLVLGHPLGFHVISQTSPTALDHLLARPIVIYVLFLAFGPSIAGSVAMSLPFALGFVWAPKVTRAAFGWLLPAFAVTATVVCGISLIGIASSESPIPRLIESNGLFSATPLLLLAFLRIRTADGAPVSRVATQLWIVALAFSTLYVAAAPADGSRGIHWGNRLLLILYPILMVLAARNLVAWFEEHGIRRRLGALTLVACVLVSGAAQAYSLVLLQERKQFSHRLSEVMKARPEQWIATDVWWAGQDLFAVFPDKSIFWWQTPQELDRLLYELGKGEDRRVLFVMNRGSVAPGAMVERIEDGRLNFFSLDVFLHRVPERR